MSLYMHIYILKMLFTTLLSTVESLRSVALAALEDYSTGSVYAPDGSLLKDICP